MNERHYGVSMLGWPPPPTHSEEIESYSANGGTHQMTSEKKQRIFLFCLKRFVCVFFCPNCFDNSPITKLQTRTGVAFLKFAFETKSRISSIFSENSKHLIVDLIQKFIQSNYEIASLYTLSSYLFFVLKVATVNPVPHNSILFGPFFLQRIFQAPDQLPRVKSIFSFLLHL